MNGLAWINLAAVAVSIVGLGFNVKTWKIQFQMERDFGLTTGRGPIYMTTMLNAVLFLCNGYFFLNNIKVI